MISLFNPLLKNDELLEYLPQRKPFVLVDSFYGILDKAAYTSFTLQKESILSNEKWYLEMVAIEFLAQSGIIMMNYKAKQNKEVVNINQLSGFICKIKKFQFSGTLRIEDQLIGKIISTYHLCNMMILHAECYVSHNKLFEGDYEVLSLNQNKE
ncbi:MAG: hypothetical protein RR034_00815 [Bacteroidales bacterium]